MTTHKFTDVEIAARVVPTLLRWPAPEIAKTIVWDKLRDAADLLRTLIRLVDDGCLAAEQDTDLSPEGISRRREAVGRKAISELANWPPLRAAERAVADNIVFLEKRMVDLPLPPTGVLDVALAQEIRAHIGKQKSPFEFVMKNLSDQRVLQAVLTVQPYLSALSEVEFNVIRERARAALHPAQAEMQVHLTKALDDLRKGVEAARRMVLERCELRLDGDGVARGIRTPLPKALAGAKSAAG